MGKKSEKVTTIRRIADSPLSVLNSHLTGSTRQTTQTTPHKTRKPLKPNASEYIRHILSRSPRLICTLFAPDQLALMPSRAAEHIATLASILPFFTITHLLLITLFHISFFKNFFLYARSLSLTCSSSLRSSSSLVRSLCCSSFGIAHFVRFMLLIYSILLCCCSLRSQSRSPIGSLSPSLQIKNHFSNWQHRGGMVAT